MKRLSLYLFLIFFTLQTPSWADDIRDFQIEGMSVGDSALDYFSEKEIKNNTGPYYPKSKKFFYAAFNTTSEVYDAIQFHIKTGDAKYIIESMEGIISYRNNIKDCYRKMEEVVDDLAKTFKSVTPSKKEIHKVKWGKGTIIRLEFNSGDTIIVACNDYKKKYKDFPDGLKISIETNEFKNWMDTEAFE